jgi:hypothetical protein
MHAADLTDLQRNCWSGALSNVYAAKQSGHGSSEREVSDEGKEKLDHAFDSLEHETPSVVARSIHWLRGPQSRWLRLPTGLLLIVLGCFGFLPVIGYELIPIGLLLIAQDVPFLRKPVSALTIWLVGKWVQLRRWWRR